MNGEFNLTFSFTDANSTDVNQRFLVSTDNVNYKILNDSLTWPVIVADYINNDTFSVRVKDSVVEFTKAYFTTNVLLERDYGDNTYKLNPFGKVKIWVDEGESMVNFNSIEPSTHTWYDVSQNLDGP